MHPNLDELLAHRDGDGSADTVLHVETCDQCRSTIEELRSAAAALGRLPSIPPPDNAWNNIRNRVVTRRRRWLAVRLAAAAVVVLAVAATVWMVGIERVENVRLGAEANDTRLAIEHLSGASRELESVLRETSLRNRVLSPRRAAMIVELEDRIALVDIALAQHTELKPDQRAVALWSDRVELLDALVTVRGGDRASADLANAVNRN